MADERYRYLHLDVFTDKRFEGNQLAVFPDARGLGTADMQTIAREIGFSETTFVLPSEAEGTDVRMRIFTPSSELPMAGHPTIGSTFALAQEGQIEARRPRFVFGLGVGPTPVDLEWGADGQLTFAWMTQLRPTFGKPTSVIQPLAAALGISADEILRTKLPVQDVSCGLPFLFVPLATRRAVDDSWLETSSFRAFSAQSGLNLPVFIFSTEPGPDRATAYSRMFAPEFGVVEDPATGSASGPLGCYLVRHGVVPPSKAKSIVSYQGVKMGRPSRIHIAIGTDGDEITNVKVGGTSVFVAEGTLKV